MREAQTRSRRSTLGFPRLLAVRPGGTPDDNALNPNAEGCEADDTDRVDSTFKSVASLAI